MTARLLTAAGCVTLSLLCVWVVDPGSRSVAVMYKGALWGLAGILVVALVRLVADRRSATRDRRLAQ